MPLLAPVIAMTLFSTFNMVIFPSVEVDLNFGCVHRMSKYKGLEYTDLALYCLILQIDVLQCLEEDD